MKTIDLHVHSTASDGTDTPTEVVNNARAAGLSAFALTDHDTTSGLSEAFLAAKEAHIEFIPGIEFSCNTDIDTVKSKEIHMLGLFIDYENAYFSEFVDNLALSRNNRNIEMTEKLNEQGFDITLSELNERFGNAVITRAHFARMLLEKGYVSDIKKAFDKYLGDGGPCYVKREKINPKQAIDMIHQAGGLAILAHPMLYKLERPAIKELITLLSKMGLDGVEAIYSTNSASDESFLRQTAKELGLGYSGGSDYHGLNKPHIKLGTGRGRLCVGYHVLEQLKERRNIL